MVNPSQFKMLHTGGPDAFQVFNGGDIARCCTYDACKPRDGPDRDECAVAAFDPQAEVVRRGPALVSLQATCSLLVLGDVASLVHFPAHLPVL